MKTIDEIRRLNLLAAIARLGTAAELAAKSGLSAAYLSQIKNRSPESKTGKPKGLGDEAARKIEAALGEPLGWMDRDHTQGDVAGKALPVSQTRQPEDDAAVSSSAHAYNPLATPPWGSRPIVVRPITTYESLEELPAESTVLITRIDVQLSAGAGRETWHIEEREPLPFQADYIKRLDSKPKDLVAVKVDGDSMEPRLFDGDTAIVDRADTRVPANGKVFALVYAGELLVKRLQRLPDGGLKVISDNHERYEAITVPGDQVNNITIVGRVKYRSGTGDF
ncbi:S24 family peptidase [Cupriavidus basilensis]|uniref:S24 family peptidase n=1 Tax=Cupriavidus basilensis TaxID=68895 RepID=UPI00283EFD78|nr:S24 family peptidase [Cupriavidus basilensis]MDR3381765.1 S24 family peptidase [Cupriavidus basilensis]